MKKKVQRYRKKRSVSWFPFPVTRLAKHRYCEQFSIDPTTSLVGAYVFAANGMYDPNITGFGHQPYGFDQHTALYNHYTVIGAKITAYLINPTSACMVGIKLSDAALLNTTDPLQLLEQPGYKKRMITHADQAEKTQISYKFSTYKFFRRSKQNIMADDSLKGSAANNPSEQAYFHVCLAPLVSGTDLPVATLHVTIDYISLWHGPKELGAS